MHVVSPETSGTMKAKGLPYAVIACMRLMLDGKASIALRSLFKGLKS